MWENAKRFSKRLWETPAEAEAASSIGYLDLATSVFHRRGSVHRPRRGRNPTDAVDEPTRRQVLVPLALDFSLNGGKSARSKRPTA